MFFRLNRLSKLDFVFTVRLITTRYSKLDHMSICFDDFFFEDVTLKDVTLLDVIFSAN